jgi:hypothetical protein
MTTFFADPALGGSGTTYTSQDFEAGGYVTGFFPALNDSLAVAQQVADTAADVAADRLAAQQAAFTPATSTTTETLASSGAVTWQTQSGKTFPVGYKVRAASNANPSTHWMDFAVDSYSGTTLNGTAVDKGSGTGDRSDWTFSPAPGGGGDVQSTLTLTAAGLVTGGGDLSANRTFTVTAAVDTDIWAGSSASKAVTPDALKDSAAPVALSDAATITPDLAAGADFTVTIAASRTLANMSNKVVGRKGVIIVTMGGSGGYSFTLGSDYRKLDSFELASGVGDVTRVDYHVISASVVHLISSGPYAA